MTRPVTTVPEADKPLTLHIIRNHAVLVIVGFFIVSILTSFISTNAFQWNTKSDIKEIKTAQEQSIEKNKDIESSMDVLSKEVQDLNIATTINTQGQVYIKEKVDKLEEDVKSISHKQDEIIRLLLEKK